MSKSGLSGRLDRDAFMKALRSMKPDLEEDAKEETRRRAQRIIDRAKQLAPVGDPEKGDPHPGRLVEDIGIKDEGPDYIDVGTTVEEGFYQEFGTVTDPPHPFMRPAIAEEEAGL